MRFKIAANVVFPVNKSRKKRAEKVREAVIAVPNPTYNLQYPLNVGVLARQLAVVHNKIVST